MGCPDPNLIAAFVGGMLDPVRAEHLDGHVDGCTACDELALRFTLARALWDAGRDRPRAIALARQAAEAQIRPRESVTRAEISAWLAAHAPP